jgi:spoIIIJ-associated protein
MTATEGTGRTIDDAIEHALQLLGAARDDVTVEVLQEPRQALLGFGGREARVRVTPRRGAADLGKAFSEAALQLMGYAAEAHAEDTPEGISVTLEGSEIGRLVERHGRTLDALELLLAVHLHRETGRRTQVVVDAGGYRARREETLVEQAVRAAERAVAERTAVALDPMDPRDRRTVHLALRDDERVSTSSEGEGEHRHVVIAPLKPGDRKDPPPAEE